MSAGPPVATTIDPAAVAVQAVPERAVATAGPARAGVDARPPVVAEAPGGPTTGVPPIGARVIADVTTGVSVPTTGGAMTVAVMTGTATIGAVVTGTAMTGAERTGAERTGTATAAAVPTAAATAAPRAIDGSVTGASAAASDLARSGARTIAPGAWFVPRRTSPSCRRVSISANSRAQ